jgi:hypothetical protein
MRGVDVTNTGNKRLGRRSGIISRNYKVMGLSMTQLRAMLSAPAGKSKTQLSSPPGAFSSLTILIEKDSGSQPSFQSEIV